MDEDLAISVRLHDIEEHLDVAQARVLPFDRNVHVRESRLRDEKSLLPVPPLIGHGQIDDDLVALLPEQRNLLVADLSGRGESGGDHLEIADGLEGRGTVLLGVRGLNEKGREKDRDGNRDEFVHDPRIGRERSRVQSEPAGRRSGRGPLARARDFSREPVSVVRRGWLYSTVMLTTCA